MKQEEIRKFKPKKVFKCRRCGARVGEGQRKTIGYKVSGEDYCHLCFLFNETHRGSQGLNNGLSAGRMTSWGRGCR